MRERHARFATAAALATVMLTAAPDARAEDEVDATSLRVERLASDAFARVERGAYKEAVELYLQANDAAPSAVLAFDIAWLYDKHLGGPALALDYYRRVLAAPDATPDLAARAAERSSRRRIPARPSPARGRRSGPGRSSPGARGSSRSAWGWASRGREEQG